MKKYFVTGLIILLPAIVTIAILGFLINFLTGPFIGAASHFLNEYHIINKGFLFLTPEQLVRYGSQFIILLLLFFVTIAIGIIARMYVIRALFSLGDKILLHIPVVNTVYKTSSDIIKTVFVSDKNSFQQVVMVPFPRPDVYALGLISRESPAICSDKVGKELISVLIPTTPNPTTGFLLIYPKEDLIYVDMKPEEAIKYVVSCGVIIPEKKQP